MGGLISGTIPSVALPGSYLSPFGAARDQYPTLSPLSKPFGVSKIEAVG